MDKFFTKALMSSFLEEVFPQVKGKFTIFNLNVDNVLVKPNVRNEDLRPVGTISGPSMFFLLI